VDHGLLDHSRALSNNAAAEYVAGCGCGRRHSRPAWSYCHIPDTAFSAVCFCSYGVRRTVVRSTIDLLSDSYTLLVLHLTKYCIGAYTVFDLT